DGVIQQLMDTHRVMRRRNVRALVMGLVASVLIAFSAFSTGSWVRAYLAQLAAEDSRDSEMKARLLEKKERERADERARVATSRQFAALSTSERSRRMDRSLLLAVEALRAAEGSGSENSFEARASLFSALQDRPELTSLFHIKEGYVWSVAFSPDG